VVLAPSRPPLALHPFPTRRSSDLFRQHERHLPALPTVAPALLRRRSRHVLRGFPELQEPVIRRDRPARVLLLWQLHAAKRIVLRSEGTRLNSSHDQISYAVFCLKK